MKHMNFIDDQQSNLLYKFCIAGALASDNIPLLRRRDDDLCLHNLRLSQLHVASVLPTLDAEPCESFAKLLSDFSSQGFHWCHVDNLEVVSLDSKLLGIGVFSGIWDGVLANCVEDRQHGSVSFTLCVVSD